ncbi:MAG: prephenate dehydratase, partial [Saprospiraceae bacterium]
MTFNTLTQPDSMTATTERPLRIAIQGYQGAFHEIAARFYYDKRPIEIVPAHTFDDLIQMMEDGEVADVALMAIENTIAGSLMYNYNLLNQSELQITGETYLRIKQNLMVLPGVKIEDLKEVHSHPVALAQCRKFFANYPDIKLVSKVDTALCAKKVQKKQKRRTGAIASTLAAEMYDLEIIGESIETNKMNYTRFLVLERKLDANISEKANKISLHFTVKHEPGSLQKVLSVISAYDANMSKIQSAPIVGKQWQYRFFV